MVVLCLTFVLPFLKQALYAKYDGYSFPIHTSAEYGINFKKDFVLEFVWKLFSFTYYACAEQFAAYPLDLSQLYMKFEEEYNERLFFRWLVKIFIIIIQFLK